MLSNDLQVQTRFGNWVEVLQARAAESPLRDAFIFLPDGEEQEVHLTYEMLDRQARAIATALRNAGAAGGRAMLLYPPGLEFIAGLFGCWFAGVTAVPAYPPRSASHSSAIATLSAIAQDAEPAVIMTASRMRPTIEATARSSDSLRRAVLVSSDEVDHSPSAWVETSHDPNAIAMLQYTSGSTGTPRGVMLTEANLLANSQVIRDSFGHTPDSVGVLWLPPYHDMGLIGGILQPVFAGFKTYFMAPAAFLQRPARWLRAVSRYGGTTSGGPNFAYELCLKNLRDEDRASLDLSRWQVAFSGAEPVQSATLDRFAKLFAPCGFSASSFYACYGLAESTLMVSGGDPGAGLTIEALSGRALAEHRLARPESEADCQSFVACGRPRPSLGGVKIVHPETLAECPSDRIGEIWIKSSSVARGYWRKPEETAAAFGAHLAGSGAGPFLRTGDLGFLKDGELFVTGRLKDLIIIRGLNHYPQDIEQTVQACHPAPRPGCGAAFSVTVDGEERLVVVQEIERAQRDADLNAVVESIRCAIAEEHELQLWSIVLLKPAQILKTSSGKVRRRACKSAFLEKTFEPLHSWTAAVATPSPAEPKPSSESTGFPATIAEMESLLATRLANALNVGVSEIDPAEPFARYGLDSAGAVSLAGILEQQLGISLPATIFYDYPCVTEMAKHLMGIES